jgi:hypothetical protein
MYACSYSRVTIAESLVRAGADVNASDKVVQLTTIVRIPLTHCIHLNVMT